MAGPVISSRRPIVPPAIQTGKAPTATAVAVASILAWLVAALFTPPTAGAHPLYDDATGGAIGGGQTVLGSMPVGFLPYSTGSRIGLPRVLKLPSVGIVMDVEAVGATPDGGMDVPLDPADAGWYKYGARPGEPGNAAIGGHVDYGGKIRPFWYLSSLKTGDPIEMGLSDGTTVTFYVRWERWYDPNNAPLLEIFGSAGVPEITLITCGGEFDHTTRQYLSRLVVRASATPAR